MTKLKSNKRSWYYWMYQYAKKTDYGSFIPDFDVGPLTQRQFLTGIQGQTIHKLTEREFVELKRLAKVTDMSKIPFSIKKARKSGK